MKANETHISLETAKLLKDYKVNSKYIFCSIGVKIGCNTLENQIYGYKRRIKNNVKFAHIVPIYPAYTWDEILWKNDCKFFINEYKFDLNCEAILHLLQQRKYEEADLYFRERCVFKLINQ